MATPGNKNAVKEDWALAWARNYADRKTGNRVNDILLLARLLRAKVKQRESLALTRYRKGSIA
jgi:hypothetical protein